MARNSAGLGARARPITTHSGLSLPGFALALATVRGNVAGAIGGSERKGNASFPLLLARSPSLDTAWTLGN